MKTLRRILLFLLSAGLILSVCLIVYPHVMQSLYPLRYRELVEQYSRENDLDPLLVYAVIKTESNFDPNAHSAADARGLMQITPETFEWARAKLGDDALTADDLYDPAVNIRYGVYIFSSHCREFGNLRLAAAAYHAGRGNVNRWLKNKDYSPDGQTLSVIPITETDNYVYKIVENYARYCRVYGNDPSFASVSPA